MTDESHPTDVRMSYRDPLVERLRADGRLQVGRLELLLPQNFGFCWGVDRALAIVEKARHEHSGRRMWLLNSLIHNPRVNTDMRANGIGFLKGEHATEGAMESLTKNDVVIVPAFSAEVEDMQELETRGVDLVDTTCPWVIKPHKRTLKYLREGFTTVIHGTVDHEETRATCSLVQHEGGHYIVVHDLCEAGALGEVLREKIDFGELRRILHPEAFSSGFDAEVHLERIGIINQTTMLASESRAIGDLLRDALLERDGDSGLEENFRDFDTICRATQDNQDAAIAVIDGQPDLFLVVGGYDSSNTKNLARVGDAQNIPSYHVEGPDSVDEVLSFRDRASGEIQRAENWLPQEGPLRVAFTAGASTPDTILGRVIRRVAELAGESLPDSRLTV
ncbi:MAG: 4-hydroxy-3-methylbut-2-enyl diphosphate reductase [Planctomycetes bacterium]|nr:4-hydroxy-3-methylbut-2-enyl diphosphate reductase [Planctomycetota bacterium]